MNGTTPLCAFCRETLTRFSDRCVERLTGRSLGVLPASFTTAHLRENVEKEVAKDCLVIERAAMACRKGGRLTEADLDALFEQSKQIDRYFVQRIVMPSVDIQLRFEVIEEIRKKRFRYIADLVADLMPFLEQGRPLEDGITHLYSADQFHGLVGELLFLSCVEVKKLAGSGSVRFLPPFSRAMDDFVDEVVEAMEQARHEVAADVARRFFPCRTPANIGLSSPLS
jgi:hypothetical protein